MQTAIAGGRVLPINYILRLDSSPGALLRTHLRPFWTGICSTSTRKLLGNQAT